MNQVDNKELQKKRTIKKLKSNKELYNKSLILIGAALIVGFGIIGFRLAFSSVNTSEMLKDQEVEGISFKNAKLENNNLEVEVSSATSQSIRTIEVIYKDNNGTEITRLSGYIGNTIDNDTRKLVVGTDEDLSNAYSIEYIINK